MAAQGRLRQIKPQFAGTAQSSARTMDIFAHALWAGAGVMLARRHGAKVAPLTTRRLPRITPHIRPRTVALTMTLAAVPDLFHLLPIIGWWLFSDGSLAVLHAYAIALPANQPVLPPMVALWSHHLHCVAHSAVVAGVVTALLWALTRSIWIPLLGWWSHIVIDVFTHSVDFYPSPVLYPFTQRGFDGLAWNTPWFMVANYVALAGVGLWLLWGRKGRDLGLT